MTLLVIAAVLWGGQIIYDRVSSKRMFQELEKMKEWD